jgi:hypothetical protein
MLHTCTNVRNIGFAVRNGTHDSYFCFFERCGRPWSPMCPPSLDGRLESRVEWERLSCWHLVHGTNWRWKHWNLNWSRPENNSFWMLKRIRKDSDTFPGPNGWYKEDTLETRWRFKGNQLMGFTFRSAISITFFAGVKKRNHDWSCPENESLWVLK